jgi:hypothetical protein
MNIGDTVVLTSERNYSPNIHIPAGTKGVILKVINYGNYVGYRVSFLGTGQTRMVSGNYLASA